MPPRDIPGDRILDRVRAAAWDEVAGRLPAFHPADIADLIDAAPEAGRRQLFALVPQELKPAVLAELESPAGADVVEALPDRELSDIVEEMSPDDAADLLAELPPERFERVLQLMEDEESRDVRELLQYEEDTAGGIMTTDVVAMREDETVDEALQAIAYLDVGEQFYYAYIVDARGRLRGYVDLWELLRERDRRRPLRELVHRDYIAAGVDMDQEQVAQLIGQYDLSALPVVDADGKLVGRVTADDVIEVMEEEASEDIFRLAGSDDADLESKSAVRSCAVRLPWLLITLAGGFLTSLILRRYLVRVSDMLILGAFVPIVLAMGGNAGIQSSTLVVRSLALGGLRGRSVARLLLRELLTGAIMGCVCGLIIGLWAHLVIARGEAAGPVFSSLHLAAVVALALFSAMTFAAMFGALAPIVLSRFRIDPAVASGPFVTIANDIAALLIYFLVTASMVVNLA